MCSKGRVLCWKGGFLCPLNMLYLCKVLCAKRVRIKVMFEGQNNLPFEHLLLPFEHVSCESFATT